MKEVIKQQLYELEALDTKALLKIWGKWFDAPPKRVRRDYLVASIAYKIQAKAYGGLSQTIRNKLRRLAFENQMDHQDKYLLSPGIELVRKWNGKNYRVSVIKGGFTYEGRHYRSLSVIAREITGAHWSGPVFFGVRKTRRKKNAEAS